MEPDVAPLGAPTPVTRAAVVESWSPGVLEASSSRLLGTLVHRLLQRQPSDADAEQVAQQLVRIDEFAEIEDLQNVTSRAAALFRSLRAHADVAPLLAAGVCHYEVPFSWHGPGGEAPLVRGRIDCVVQHGDARLTILEFKTGQPRPEHSAQTSVYVEALRAARPGWEIDAKIVYG
jgi:ATP-dependent exoDNAse (exonuclease V) beta subunit